MRFLYSLILLGLCSVYAIGQTQKDSVLTLETVVLSDVKLLKNTYGFKTTKLKDSVLENDSKSFTDVLRFNSNIYFKENGYGMVASPSFRGTNASQTAVIWNGISINSQLNGQTDFNLINTNNFDQIVIKNGGGSVQYGSGAIGGSIHLNNTLDFSSHFEHQVRLSYGSFNTQKASYTTNYGSSKFAANFGFQYVTSDNDYKYLDTDDVNENGAFNNLNFNLNLGYFISDHSIIKLFHQSFIGERELSGTLNTISRSKYLDENFRSMIEWTTIGNTFTSKVKLAHLQELFKFYQNKTADNYSFGKVNTYLIKHILDYNVSNKLALKSILDYNYFEADGSSFGSPIRNAFSATAIATYKPNAKSAIGLNIRQDVTSGFKSPLLFSVDGSYRFNTNYKVLLNASKNFRVPTFNDLFWQPGGNPNLKPETSYQVDLGHQISYKWVTLDLNTYYIKNENLIQWKPSNSGFWSPINIDQTHSYGTEVGLTATKSLGKHQFKFTGNYSYTISENTKTKKQLIYVPKHKANLSLAYNYKRLSFYYQHLYNDMVFTTSDNLTGPFYSLPDYDIANTGIKYQLIKNKSHDLKIGLDINNVFNVKYNNVAFRPMPNQNYNIQIHYKF
ncbi:MULTISPECIES: TonB-dependent receptor plug domain-containing protein [Mesoflavibacter]|uniref:TonB-dependent receptor n=1 Tax=Mesoflavibacter profundi TaxID=2708110 RepID=A0ABT4RYZ9_9FLAO|nr:MULTISPECIES: TonB-dependent receptor [Mesoflavibacter]MDA0176975.1 TonB-dependent receptor [Mesoflavibacter profundi]QIJ87890.1 Outer membrane vitamin B12 receptor BtuB [Mesoflavibacter sp. HG96]QIJ90618.1 Outer membrane vitamin B12 receptor BtuB [Mesoflavibacter sp. HG37]